MMAQTSASGAPTFLSNEAAITTELRILLCCARLRWGPAQHARIRQLLREEIDWVRLVRGAASHRLLPLLYSHLQELGDELPHRSVLAHLRELCDDNARRTLRLIGELLQIIRLFEGNGIPVVPYKGPVMAAQLYGNVVLRHAGDLDILVRRRDVPKARELLLSRGYALRRPFTDANYAYCEEFIGPNRTVVELHWAFTRKDVGFRLTLEELLPRLERTRIGGAPVSVFATEDLLLILCIHGAKHRWERLEWLCGVAELMRARDPRDWTRILERATGLRCRRALLLAARLAHDLLDAPVPEPILDEARRSRSISTLFNESQQRLLRECPADASQPVAAVSNKLFQIQVADRLRDRLRYRFYRPLARRITRWKHLWLRG